MNFGSKLRKIRKMRGLSLKNVADALKIGASTLSEYENNMYELSLSKMFALLDFYNIEPWNFIKTGEEYIRITDYSEINKKKSLQ